MKSNTRVATAVLLLALLPAVAGPLPLTSSREIDLGENPNRAVVADLNGDGVPDVARTDHNGNGVFVCLNRGDATFTVLPRVLDEMWVWSLVARDLDGDGAAEIVATGILPDEHSGPIAVINAESTALVLLENDGAGGLSPLLLTRRCEYRTPPSLTDLDGDGDVDIAYERYWGDQPPYAGTLYDDGTGAFVPGADVDVLWLRIAQAAYGGQVVHGEPETNLSGEYFLDIDGDGRNDRVTVRGRVCSGRGDGTFSVSHPYGDETLNEGEAPFELADLDGDGDLDLVIPTLDGHVSVLLNQGAGEFGRNHEYRLSDDDLGFLADVEAGDFDGDGRTDVLAIGTEGSRLLTLDGEPPPSIDSISPALVGAGVRQVVEVRGTDFTPETTLDFGRGNSVVDVEFESSERLLATVDAVLRGYDDPSEDDARGYDVIAEGPYGGSSRLLDAFRVEPYWDGALYILKGRLRDSKKPGKDRFLVEACDVGSSYGWRLLEQAGRDLHLVFGGPLDPYELVVPGDDPGWRVHALFDWTTQTSLRTGLSWRSPDGASPRVSIDILPHQTKPRWQYRISVRDFDFAGPQSKNLRMELYLGDIRIASAAEWKKIGKRRFRARRRK